MTVRVAGVRLESDRRGLTVDMEGFMRPPKGLTARERWDIERFAYLTGIGPLFDVRPKHHGQHSWCCEGCNKYRDLQAQKVQDISQPYDVKPSRFAA